MRSVPDGEYDAKELAKLRSKPWQIELLSLNPEYVSWGPHEDYMIVRGGGWDSPVIKATWSEFGPWELGDLNECPNFYFELKRASHDCQACKGSGQNAATREISRSFYDFEGVGNRWVDAITEDEHAALVATGRHNIGKTAEETNAFNRLGSASFGNSHDAINSWILIETRAKRLGVHGACAECEGGTVYDADEAHVSLVLWWMHPRKGCSRGVEIERIEEVELPAVFAFLAEAAKRNADRFAKVVAKSKQAPGPEVSDD